MEKLKELEEKWCKFRLSEKEATDIMFNEEEDEALRYKEDRSLVGRVFSSRVISMEVLGSTMGKVWRISKAAKFLELCTNIFVITFETQADKERVWAGRPWLFDHQLLAMKSFNGFTPPQRMSFEKESFWVRMYNLPLMCMTKARGEQIGGMVGYAEEVDTQVDGSGWGKVLKEQIKMNIKLPIPRSITIKVKGESLWIPFSDEKLPRLCFSCGCIVHGESGCLKQEGDDDGGNNIGYG
ncbi:hypothetical protein F2P56_003924 [Juglans regia]|uniref:Uncharacterized protein LOC109004607 n=2 Tax=Juglans regia TaxID=51240 RepID=A0A2I4G4E0_JUGRE|nr:uncharacterized protein LOC109004607 [Juglans regia]KAF5477274.1 hypothetical protein F2P56_003924 [Juglans regia]